MGPNFMWSVGFWSTKLATNEKPGQTIEVVQRVLHELFIRLFLKVTHWIIP